MGMREKILLGEAAEHLVLAGLLRRGHVASQAPRAWKADDILGQNDLRIQVKATEKGTKVGWIVGNVKASPHRFYALVDFTHEADPRIYILPSQTVRGAAEEAYRMARCLFPERKPTRMRKIEDPYPYKLEGYAEGWLKYFHDRWDLLEGFRAEEEEATGSVLDENEHVVVCHDD